MQTYLKTILQKQQGAAMVELILGGVLVLLVTLGAIQMLLVYKAMLQLQQATFEAARAGIVNNAKTDAITAGFIRHSLDFHGGGTNMLELIEAEARANVAVAPILNPAWNPLNAGYKLEILNPTREAFQDHGMINPETQERFIPNSWQHIKDPNTIGATSGANIQDANILKIRITYGVPLKVPFIGRMIGEALEVIDPQNRPYYQAATPRLPLQFTAIMHMQSDPIENQNTSRFFQRSLENMAPISP